MSTLVQSEGIKGVTLCGNDVVEIAYSGTELGNTAARFEGYPGEADANLARLRSAVGVGRRTLRHTLILAQQLPDFEDLTGVPATAVLPEYRTDGVFTDSSDLAISLRPADCLNMVYYSATGEPLLGLIHGGRGGIDGDIHLKAVDFMLGHGIAREAIRIFSGPAISAASYYFNHIDPAQEVDPRWSPFIERFECDKDKGHKEHKERKENGEESQYCYHVDLPGRVVADLKERAGLQPAQLREIRIDTGANPAYFSHARSHRAIPQGLGEGRNGIVVKLR